MAGLERMMQKIEEDMLSMMKSSAGFFNNLPEEECTLHEMASIDDMLVSIT